MSNNSLSGQRRQLSPSLIPAYSRQVTCKLCYLTLILLNPDIPCLYKQCRSRSVGFFRSRLIWICTVVIMYVNLYQHPGTNLKQIQQRLGPQVYKMLVTVLLLLIDIRSSWTFSSHLYFKVNIRNPINRKLDLTTWSKHQFLGNFLGIPLGTLLTQALL